MSVIGGRPAGGGTPVARYSPKRWCSVSGCGTRLSVYNPQSVCGACLRAGLVPAEGLPPPKREDPAPVRGGGPSMWGGPKAGGRRLDPADAAALVASAWKAGVRPGTGHRKRHLTAGTAPCARALFEASWYYWQCRNRDKKPTEWRPFDWYDLTDNCGIRAGRPGPDPSSPCGTAAAYKRHLQRGEETCQACRAANNRRRKQPDD